MKTKYFLPTLIIIGFILIPISVIFADAQEYENQYGKLVVYPDIDTNDIFHKQFWNLTSYYTGMIDIAFAFDINLINGGCYRWNGNNYTKMDINKIIFNNRF